MQTACRVNALLPIRTPAAPNRRNQQQIRSNCSPASRGDPGQNADSRSAAALGAVELPGGVLWWHDKQHGVYKHDIVYGQDFVLQRTRSGGPGLVLSQRLSSMQIVDKAERTRVHLEMYKAAQSGTDLQLFQQQDFDFDLTDNALVEYSSADMAGNAEPQHFSPTSCVGIVLREQPGQMQPQVVCHRHTVVPLCSANCDRV